LGTVFSPDGKWVAYADNDIGGGVPSRNRGVYVEPFPPTGTKWQATKVGNDYHPTWSSDGHSLFYLPTANGTAVRVPFFATGSFGSPVPVGALTRTRFPSSEHRSYELLPKDRFLMLVNPDSAPVMSSIRVVQNWPSELQRVVPKN